MLFRSPPFNLAAGTQVQALRIATNPNVFFATAVSGVAALSSGPTVIAVALDIKPGADPNPVNPGAAGNTRNNGGPSCLVVHASSEHWEIEAFRF